MLHAHVPPHAHRVRPAVVLPLTSCGHARSSSQGSGEERSSGGRPRTVFATLVADRGSGGSRRRTRCGLRWMAGCALCPVWASTRTLCLKRVCVIDVRLTCTLAYAVRAGRRPAPARAPWTAARPAGASAAGWARPRARRRAGSAAPLGHGVPCLAAAEATKARPPAGGVCGEGPHSSEGQGPAVARRAPSAAAAAAPAAVGAGGGGLPPTLVRPEWDLQGEHARLTDRVVLSTLLLCGRAGEGLAGFFANLFGGSPSRRRSRSTSPGRGQPGVETGAQEELGPQSRCVPPRFASTRRSGPTRLSRSPCTQEGSICPDLQLRACALGPQVQHAPQPHVPARRGCEHGRRACQLLLARAQPPRPPLLAVHEQVRPGATPVRT
jgi:hypothetical protein